MVVPPRLSDPLVMSYLATSFTVSLADKDGCEPTSSGKVIPGAYFEMGRKQPRPVVREKIVK